MGSLFFKPQLPLLTILHALLCTVSLSVCMRVRAHTHAELWGSLSPSAGNTSKAAERLHGNQPLHPSGLCSVEYIISKAGAGEPLNGNTQRAVLEGRAPSWGLLMSQ